MAQKQAYAKYLQYWWLHSSNEALGNRLNYNNKRAWAQSMVRLNKAIINIWFLGVRPVVRRQMRKGYRLYISWDKDNLNEIFLWSYLSTTVLILILDILVFLKFKIHKNICNKPYLVKKRIDIHWIKSYLSFEYKTSWYLHLVNVQSCSTPIMATRFFHYRACILENITLHFCIIVLFSFNWTNYDILNCTHWSLKTSTWVLNEWY